jgi:hypothetical protein
MMKPEPGNRERSDSLEVLSEDSSPGRPDTPTDESTQSPAERKNDLVSDPKYPNYDNFLDVADKLLKSLEER